MKLLSWKNELTWIGSTFITFKVLNFPFELHLSWSDRRRNMSRAFISFGWSRGYHHYGILLQHYREGFDFEKHTDGPTSNKVLTFVLHRPKAGGEFFGRNVRRWLGGRVLAFDGAEEHGVTRIERGSRTVLMFQHGVFDAHA